MCSRDGRLVRVQAACVHSKTGVQRCSGAMAAQELWVLTLTRAVLALRWTWNAIYQQLSPDGGGAPSHGTQTGALLK